MMAQVFWSRLAWVLFLLHLSTASVNISTAKELINLFNTTSSVDDEINLCDDLDFSYAGLTSPLGLVNGSCFPFSGKLRGHGHTIKGVVLSSHSPDGYAHVGLFCKLADATIQDLIIDSSCSFTGQHDAGALAVDVTGSLTVTNVTNKANVSGKTSAGGFVAKVPNLSLGKNKIVFDRCVNEGNITGSVASEGGNYPASGGFVGSVSGEKQFELSFSNSVNRGRINSGELSKDDTPSGSGGFVGVCVGQHNIEISLQSCVNDGDIDGKYNAGGFVGFVDTAYQRQRVMSVSNCTNNGLVNGARIASGIACIYDNAQWPRVNVTVISSTNNGDVRSSSNIACGLVYYNSKGATVTILNSINRGSVTGTEANGIGNFVTEADNVVSMGTIVGKACCSFWNTSVTSDSAYTLGSGFRPCGDLIPHYFSLNSGRYRLLDKDELLEEELNRVLFEKHYSLNWTSNITLSSTIRIDFGRPAEDYVYVAPGKTVSVALAYSSIAEEQFSFVDRSTWVVLEPSSPLDRDTEIALCHKVIVTGAVSGTFYAEHGVLLRDTRGMEKFFSDEFVVTNTSSRAAVDGSLAVSQPVSITVQRIKTVTVVISFDEEGGVGMGDIEEAIKDIVAPDERDGVRVVVSVEDDGVYVVSVTTTEDSADTITGALIECSKGRK